MPRSIRTVLAVVVGVVVWVIVATAGNLLIRGLLAGYAEVEKAMTFSSGMLLARLVLGALASVAAGAACAAVGRSVRPSVYWFGVLLLALFVPVHVGLWEKFPIWYHVVFLGSLAPLVIVGAKWAGFRGASAA